MSLLSLDHAVWQDILLNWLGSLREIVRLDFAVDVADIKNQFRDVFAHLAFPLPMTVRVTQDFLVGLCSWMQLRNVHLCRVEVEVFFVGWEAIFAWCRNSLRQLHISGFELSSYCQNTSYILNAASNFCHCLQELTLVNGKDQNGETLRTILRNNASTLVVLRVENMFGGNTSALYLDDIVCSKLQVLLWENEEHSSLGAFLQRCPKLSALSVSCDGHQIPKSLVSAISESCPALKRLRLYAMQGLDSNALLRIARGCSKLEFLEISDNDEWLSEGIIEVKQALPFLHTLKLNDEIINGAVWLEIAVRGLAPSLRVLDVNTEFTCTGLRQFTAAYPHLTGLRLLLNGVNTNMDNKTLFEHCGEMNHLILNMYFEPIEAVDAVLESVALCCPRLEILELSHGFFCNTWALQLVLDKCTHLKHLIAHCTYGGKLHVPPGVIVPEESLPLSQWMSGAGISVVVV